MNAKLLAKIAAYVLAFALPPILIAAGAIALKLQLIGAADAPALTKSLSPPPDHNPAKRTAVILANNHGTEITDFLPPYEILAASRAFNVYVVAPERRVSPVGSAMQLPSGLAILPHYSLVEYEQAIGAAPDLIVIPVFTGYNATRDAVILDWLRRHVGSQTTILTICAATQVLADTGLLDGHTATSYHYSLSRFRKRYPGVNWIRNTRYVDDGNVISSSSLASGIDATLHTVDKLVGREVAERVAHELRYPHTRFLDDPTYVLPTRFNFAFAPNAAYDWSTTDLGVLLYDGVSETALAALLDAYAVSVVKVHTLATEPRFYQSKYGLTLAPRWTLIDAPPLDRLIVVGDGLDMTTAERITRWTETRRLEITYLQQQAPDAYAYDAAFIDIARREGAAVAEAATHNLVYPAMPQLAPETFWSMDVFAWPLLIGLLGLGTVLQWGQLRGLSRVG